MQHPPTPQATLGMGSECQNSTFSEHGQLNVKLKRNTNAATWLPAAPTLTLGMGQNSNFSEHGHVTYYIKDNHECSNMVANILPPDPLPLDPGNGVNRSKFNFFHGHCI